MKFILTLIIFLFTIQFFSAQKYSRVKVFANEQELMSLSSLGVPTDHGIRKKGTFLISDFSEQEIEILNTYGYTYEVQIDDVQEFYIGLNAEGTERKSFKDVKHYKRKKRWLS